jgi:hypothetical protein
MVAWAYTYLDRDFSVVDMRWEASSATENYETFIANSRAHQGVSSDSPFIDPHFHLTPETLERRDADDKHGGKMTNARRRQHRRNTRNRPSSRP